MSLNASNMYIGDTLKGDLQKGFVTPIAKELIIFFYLISTSRWQYKNLPNEIDDDMIEAVLFTHGYGAWWNISGVNFFTQIVGQDRLNAYGRFSHYKPIVYNGIKTPKLTLRKSLDADGNITQPNAVLLRGNYSGISPLVLIKPLVNRLADIWVTMGIKSGLSRVKTLISADSDSAKTLEKVFNKMFGSNKFSLVVDTNSKERLSSSIDTFDLNVDYDPNKDWYDFDKCWSMILTILGINNNMQNDKKERLNVDEVNSNNECNHIAIAGAEQLRRKFVDDVNKMFNLNIELVALITDQAPQEKENKDLEQEKSIPNT